MLVKRLEHLPPNHKDESSIRKLQIIFTMYRFSKEWKEENRIYDWLVFDVNGHKWANLRGPSEGYIITRSILSLANRPVLNPDDIQIFQ